MTATMMTLNKMRREEAIVTITIMTTITTTKAGGGYKGTAHPRVGTTYNIVVIVPKTNTRSSSMNIGIGNSSDDGNVSGSRGGACIIRTSSSCLVIIAAVHVLIVSLLPTPRGMTIMSIIAQKRWQ